MGELARKVGELMPACVRMNGGLLAKLGEACAFGECGWKCLSKAKAGDGCSPCCASGCVFETDE